MMSKLQLLEIIELLISMLKEVTLATEQQETLDEIEKQILGQEVNTMAKYFNYSGFECPHCHQNHISDELIAKLDELRERWGKPIKVTSGWRCKEHNAQIGGVGDSVHCDGLAADICLPGDFNAEEYKVFYGFVCGTGLFNAVGYYPNQEIVHVDIRAGRPNEYGWNYDYPTQYFYRRDY